MPRKRYTKQDYENKISELYGNKFKLVSEFIDFNTKIKIKHVKCDSIFEILPNELTRSRRQENFKKDLCPLCTNKNLYTEEENKEKLKILSKGQLSHIGSNKTNTRQKTVFRCNICGNTFKTSYHNIFENYKKKKNKDNFIYCKYCNYKIGKDTTSYKKELKEKRHNQYILCKNKEYKNTDTKIKIRHKTCNKSLYYNPSDLLYGNVSCPYCYGMYSKNGARSKYEMLIEYYLYKFNIEYIKEYTTTNLKYKSSLYFDFYLPEYNLAIEYDGSIHFKESIKIEKLKIKRKRDLIKNKCCKKLNISLLRIPFGLTKDSIYDILDSLNNEKLTKYKIRKYKLYYYDSETHKTINKDYFNINKDNKEINLILDEEENFIFNYLI